MKKCILGITGTTGSGKSIISSLLQPYGFVVIDADKVSRELTVPNSSLVKKLACEFGNVIVRADGSLDRKLLAGIAFSDPDKKRRLNAITHPIIIDAINTRIAQYLQEGRHLIILDAPLLFESNSDKLCDFTISVHAPPDLRLKRIMERDSISKENALLRINAQNPSSYYAEKSDITIENDGDLPKLSKQILSLATRLLEEYRNE